MATKKVLARSHRRSLQLLCTVGGNQARSDARSGFKILEHSLKGGWKLVVHIAVTGYLNLGSETSGISERHSSGLG